MQKASIKLYTIYLSTRKDGVINGFGTRKTK